MTPVEVNSGGQKLDLSNGNEGWLWHRLLGRPVSESGRLCHGMGPQGGRPLAEGASVAYARDLLEWGVSRAAVVAGIRRPFAVAGAMLGSQRGCRDAERRDQREHIDLSIEPNATSF